MTDLPRRHVLGFLLAGGALAACKQGDGSQGALSRQRLIAPAAVAAKLARGEKPVIFYVGPNALYRRGHLPGAKNLGEAGSDTGIAALRTELEKLPAGTEAIVYCGCCAVAVCPNVRPADAVLAKSGRTNVWLLDLPTNLQTDWTDAGHPVEKG